MSAVSYRSHEAEGGPGVLGTSSLMPADRIHICVARSNVFQLRMQTVTFLRRRCTDTTMPAADDGEEHDEKAIRKSHSDLYGGPGVSCEVL